MIIVKKISTPAGSKTRKEMHLKRLTEDSFEIIVDKEIDIQAEINSYRDHVAIERIYAQHILGDDTLFNANPSVQVPEGVDLDLDTNVDATLKKLYESYKYKDDVSFNQFANIVLAGKFGELNVTPAAKEVKTDGE